MKKCLNCGYVNDDFLKDCVKCSEPLSSSKSSHNSESKEGTPNNHTNTNSQDPKERHNQNADDLHIKDFGVLFDPKKTTMLDIVRITVIVINSLVLFAALILLGDGRLHPLAFLLVLFGVVIFHLVLMLALNIAYNVQQTRMNSDIQVQMLEKILDKEKDK